jgi:hypothetical protein
MPAPAEIIQLVELFERNYDQYRAPAFSLTAVRHDLGGKNANLRAAGRLHFPSPKRFLEVPELGYNAVRSSEKGQV